MTRKVQDFLAPALSALIAAVPAASQEAKPREAVGISVPQTTTLRLGEQVPELEGYELQIRTIILQPGAHSYYHSHAMRPVVAYLVSGDYTEHRDVEGNVAHSAGEQWVEGADVAHWSENLGDVPTYLINVEVLRPKAMK